VEIARENPDCVWFFDQVRFLLNLIGNSCKKTQMLQVAQAQSIVEALELGDIETGKGLNQEMGLARPVGTHWDLIMKLLCILYLYIFQFRKFS
jgi:hypothetical protein